MKRTCALLLCLTLLLTGCGPRRADQIDSPYTYYYRAAQVDYTSEDGVIRGETREISGHEGDLTWILEDYFRGPESEDLVSPFPKDLAVLNCQLKEKTVFLKLSQEFSNLSSIELSVAAACVAKTLFGTEGVDSISISVEGGLLDGKKSLTLDREGLLLVDGAGDLMRTNMTLCFGDQSGRYLIGETVTVSLANTENPQAYLMKRLADGPKDQGLRKILPEGTRILGVSVDDGLCNVNLSREFTENQPQGALAQRLVLAAIANTLTQTEGVSGVELYIEGSLLTSFGVWQLNAPLVADEGAMGPVRTGLNEFDVDLYLPVSGKQGLVEVPARVRQTANESAEELVVTTLLDYAGVNGLVNPFPTGTRLRSVAETEGVWTVDLSREVLSAGDLTGCVQAVILTLAKLEGKSAVRVTVEGSSLPGDNGQWAYPSAFEESWVLN